MSMGCSSLSAYMYSQVRPSSSRPHSVLAKAELWNVRMTVPA
jgi:hypothetical protein